MMLPPRLAQQQEADSGSTPGTIPTLEWSHPALEHLGPTEDGAFGHLKEFFRAFAAAAEGLAVPAAYVATYYLSAERLHRCQFGRRVELAASPSLWRRQLIQAWMGLLDVNSPMHFYVVSPMPIQNSEPGVPYILLVQHVREDMCPVLATINEQMENTHVATFLPPPVVRRQVLQGLCLTRRCLSSRADAVCRVRFGWQPITDDTQTVLPGGAGVHIDIQPREEDSDRTFCVRADHGGLNSRDADSGDLAHAAPHQHGPSSSSSSVDPHGATDV